MPAGQPTKLTPARHKAIVELVKGGLHPSAAVAHIGLDKKCWYNWRDKGMKAKSGKFFQFFYDVEKAKADAEKHLLDSVLRSGTGYTLKKKKIIKKPDGSQEVTVEEQDRRDWQAAAWILERRWPERYTRLERHHHGGDPNAPPIQTEMKMTVEAAKQCLEEDDYLAFTQSRAADIGAEHLRLIEQSKGVDPGEAPSADRASGNGRHKGNGSTARDH